MKPRKSDVNSWMPARIVSVTEDAERLRERLRLANAEFERLASMAEAWWELSCATESPAPSRTIAI